MTFLLLLRKAFELSGVVPLGIYLVVHVVTYARVLFGSVDFGVPSCQGWWLRVLEVGVLWLPLAFHAGYGCLLSLASPLPQTQERARKLWLRGSGLASLVFVIAHSVEYRAVLWTGERAARDVRPMLEASLSSTVGGVPLLAALHIVGLAFACLHFALGLAQFGTSWGIFEAKRARRLGTALGVLVFAAGTAAVIHLATGSALPYFRL